MKVLIAQRERAYRFAFYFPVSYKVLDTQKGNSRRTKSRARARDRTGSDHEKKTKE